MAADDPGKLLRLFRCLHLLSSAKRGFTVTELAERLGVSYRTVYRDIKIFEKTGFSIEQTSNKRYKLLKKEEISENLSFNSDEAAAIKSAIMTLGEGSIKRHLLEKVQALEEQGSEANVFGKLALGATINLLSKAIREEKQVVLYDYHSLSSESISNRFVEPFEFNKDGNVVICYELGSGQNKSFKLDRIGQVKVLERDWEHEEHHKKRREDIFGLSISNPVRILINLGEKAEQLLLEEFPRSRPFIQKKRNSSQLNVEVEGFKPIGRFCLGMMDDVTVVEPRELKQYLQVLLLNQKLFSNTNE